MPIPHLPESWKRSLVFVGLIAILIIPALILVQKSQELRKRAAENKAAVALKPLEEKILDLADNGKENSTLTLKKDKVKLTFAKGTLDTSVSRTQRVRAKIMPQPARSDVLFNMSFTLETIPAGELPVTGTPSAAATAPVVSVSSIIARPSSVRLTIAATPSAVMSPPVTITSVPTRASATPLPPTAVPTEITTATTTPSEDPAEGKASVTPASFFSKFFSKPTVTPEVKGIETEGTASALVLDKQPAFTSEAKGAGKAYYTLEYDFRELEEVYADSSLQFVYLNPRTGKWDPIDTTLDAKNSRITAKIDHFSTVGVQGDKAQVFSPTLNNWEASLYTGAVNYSMPVEVPPGRGGLQPDLSITYNSNRANALDHEQKGSWLGAGWDLTVPEIRFDKYANEDGSSNNCDPNAADTIAGTRKRGPQYSLILGGGEDQLVWVGDEGGYGKFISKQGGITVKGYYGSYLGNATFGDINMDSCRNKIIVKWDAQAKNGLKYIFDINEPGRQAFADRRIKDVMVPTKYMVTQVTDLSNNSILFYYAQESSGGHFITTYPSSISYNFGAAGGSVIEFQTQEKCEGVFRTPDGTNACIPEFPKDSQGRIRNEIEKNYEKRALDTIRVYTRWVSSTDNTLYRTYHFPHDNANFYHWITGIETYGAGTAEAKNKFVPTTFRYELRPVGLDIEYLMNNSNEPYGDGGSCDYGWPYHYGPGQLTWNDLARCAVSWRCLDGDVKYDICEGQRIKIADGKIGDCKGDNNLYGTYPAAPSGSCPQTAYAGAWGSNHFVYVSWNKARAPFLNAVNNGYGGQVHFTYTNFTNPKRNYELNRNVITSKKVFDSREDPTGANALITDYTYEANPRSDGTPRPNNGGGFGLVTATERASGMATTTFYYPLAGKTGNADDNDSNIETEKDPYYGKPLRTVTHKLMNGVEYMYSDSFTNYTFVPVHNPAFGLNFPAGTNTPLSNNLLKEGVGTLVTASADSFTPLSAERVDLPAPYDGNKPLYIPLDYRNNTVSDTSKHFLHTQTRNWFDRYGNVKKSASYASVAGFPDIAALSDIGQPRWIGLSDKNWTNADNVSKFTFGLPMTPYLFLNSAPVDPVYPGMVPADPKLRKITYSTFSANTVHLNQNMSGLPTETFVSDEDVSWGPGGTVSSQYGVTRSQYDARGLVTRSTKFDSYTPEPGSLTNPVEIITTTAYGPYGTVTEQTDGEWNRAGSSIGSKTVTTYVSDASKVYRDILPAEVKVVDKVGNVLSKTSYTYNDLLWKPEETRDTNTISGRVGYDCLGRPQFTYKPDPVTGETGWREIVEDPVTGNSYSRWVLVTPSQTNIYFDYQGAGCGVGAVNITSPLPHMRVKTRISSSGSDDLYSYTDSVSNGLGQEKQTQVLKSLVNGTEKSIVTEKTYNNRGLVVKETLPVELSAVSVTNDTSPVPSYRSLGTQSGTEYVYDNLKRVVRTTNPLGKTSEMKYEGQTTWTIDANNYGQATQTKSASMVNGFGQVVKTITVNLPSSSAPVYGIASYPEYDVQGNITKTTVKKCPNATCTGGTETELYNSSTVYDRLGRKLRVIDPDLGTWNYAYDGNGNMVTQIDAKQNTLTFEYDSSNRLIKKTYPGNVRAGLPSVRDFYEFKYDASPDNSCTIGGNNFNTMSGKLFKMNDATGDTNYCYDKRGRVVKEVKNIDKRLEGKTGLETATTTMEYYESDALKATTLPTGERVVNTLNDFGQLTQVAGLNQYLTGSYFDKFGNLKSSIYGNNRKTIQEFDAIGRLNRICVGAVSATDCNTATSKLMDYQYNTRDNTGNITQMTVSVAGLSPTPILTNHTLNFTYDGAYQLVGVTPGTTNLYSATYAYDEQGDMLSKKEGVEPAIVMNYTDPAHKHAPKSVNGVTFSYDANGNLLDDAERMYTWDYDNKPVKIWTKEGALTEMAYDGNGQRVLKKTNPPICDAGQTMKTVPLCTEFSGRYYDLRNVTGPAGTTAQRMFFYGKKQSEENGWFLSYYSTSTPPVGGCWSSTMTYYSTGVGITPDSSTEYRLLSIPNVSQLVNKLVGISAYSNTEFGSDTNLYVCFGIAPSPTVTPTPDASQPNWYSMVPPVTNTVKTCDTLCAGKGTNWGCNIGCIDERMASTLGPTPNAERHTEGNGWGAYPFCWYPVPTGALTADCCCKTTIPSPTPSFTPTPTSPAAPISCSASETLRTVTPCTVGGNGGTSIYRNYNLNGITGTVSKAVFQGSKVTDSDGWFLFYKSSDSCTNIYISSGIGVHPTGTAMGYVDATSQINSLKNQYISIVNYSNTVFGTDPNMYLCINNTPVTSPTLSPTRTPTPSTTPVLNPSQTPTPTSVPVGGTCTCDSGGNIVSTDKCAVQYAPTCHTAVGSDNCTCQQCPGGEYGNLDCDPSGYVGTADYQLFRYNFGQYLSDLIRYSGQYNPDLNRDGLNRVDTGDFEILRTHFGTMIVPTPTLTPTRTVTPTSAPTFTPVPTVTIIPTVTDTPTPTLNLNPRNTLTPTPSITLTPACFVAGVKCTSSTQCCSNYCHPVTHTCSATQIID